MAPQALLPTLLLCLLLLLQAQGGPHRRKRIQNPQLSTEIKECEKRIQVHLCRHPCKHHRECQANNVCCLSFCGSVCMNVL
ncbi:WAP four-disulfide core domain 10A [Phyllostomus discolor]|uniref:WAP four-disulfide core domain 10A n=1 Tax=Phyllostomus discolor TaxID=89673 RepID=A0A6J2MJN3_9CHIR|nr:WAP four-disulfide core domain protein 10A [Phyllostomus discolor]KAF6089774.1 WAP four-disulfide core domain 10A [Phyllostomus discolor]